jgi:hypothetical protein
MIGSPTRIICVSLCSRVSIFNQMLHIQIVLRNIVNTSNWHSYFQWYLLNTLLLVTLHNIAHTLDAFVIYQNWRSWQHGYIDTRMTIMNMFVPLEILCFLQCHLTICFFKHSYFLRNRFIQQNTKVYVHVLFCSRHFKMWGASNPWEQTTDT